MSNLFFRTNIAPYRIDTYNAIHKFLKCKMFFYWKEETSQKLDMKSMLKECEFTPNYLAGIKLGANSRKICTNIWSILKDNDPEIVIVPEFQILTIQVLLYKWIFKKKFRIISMCDDSYDMISNNHDFSLMHKWARKILTPCLDDLLLVDYKTKEWYQNKYNKGIWLPIIRNEKKERQIYKKTLSKSNELNRKYALEGEKVLLYVGRLVNIKNIDKLLEAVKYTEEEFVTVIVGDGIEKENLEKQAQTINKKILFMGHLEGEELKAWYNIADVFILPSYLEPFGAVTNEALIAGCYSIISQKAGSACLINEHNGIMINPFDAKDITNAIDNAMRKIQSKENYILLKKNLMNIYFEETVKNVIQRL